MKKKKKGKHKTKRSKKHKSMKQSSSDSSDSGDEWEEAGISNRRNDDLQPCSSSSSDFVESVDFVPPGLFLEKTPKREEWMSSSLLDVVFETTKSRENKTKERKLDSQRKEEEKKIEIYNARELNPDRKKLTHGLPVDHRVTQVKKEKKVVGDGGNSWIHKAYERAKERAKEENVPLEDIVKQRWGSMEKLQALMNVANRNQKSANSSMSSTRQGTSSGWRKHANRPKSPPSCSENLVENGNKKSCDDSNSKEKLKKDKPDTKGSSIPETEKLTMRKALSEEEKNELNAKLLRAELMGDDNLVATLKRKLDGDHHVADDDCPKQVHSKRERSDASSSDEEVILTRSDKHGNLYPIKLNADVHEKSKKKKKIISTHDDESGQRLRYFEDDDITDLKTMVEQERLTSSDDQQAMLARLAGKHLGRTMGEDYTVDDMFVQASATKGESNNENRRIKEKAIAEDRLQKKQISNCRVCLENPNIAKHLIISIGINVYLSLPVFASLTEGHCYIIPMKHVAAQTFLDEDVIQEVKKFKKGLTRMFASVNEDVMFLETCKNLHGSHHCIIECIPVPKEIGEMAPIYFKKAISEVGSEWSDNKKLITVSFTGGVYRAVPKGLPYFLIEFGLDGGFGHIIEEESFPHYFGKEVIGGMMDLEPRLWLKPPKESFELHKKKVFKFSDAWKEHDWTSKIT